MSEQEQGGRDGGGGAATTAPPTRREEEAARRATLTLPAEPFGRPNGRRLHYYWAGGFSAENLGDYLLVPVLRSMGYEITRRPGPRRLLGVGTILNEKHYAMLGGDTELVVWGSGAGYDMAGLLGEQRGLRFDFRAVRGPLTRDLLGLPGDIPLGDPALLLPHFFPSGSLPKGAEAPDRVLYVAHLKSPDLVAPDGATAVVGTRVRPRFSLHLVRRIASADFVLTSSLHGAILAQAYGVPWAPCAPRQLTINRFKWVDWYRYLGLECEATFVASHAEGVAWWERWGCRGRTRGLEELLAAFPADCAVPVAARSVGGVMAGTPTADGGKEAVDPTPARTESRSLLPESFAYSGPYQSFSLQRTYGEHHLDLYGSKVVRERDLRKRLARLPNLPEILIMHNFVVERAGILSVCRETGINTVHTEDGFFPHYGSIHLDPLGFCWESSLTRMVFRGCTDAQRARARRARAAWNDFAPQEPPAGVRPPYVLWPLQLLRDSVNRWDLNVESWSDLLRHFRACLPSEYQLVVKPHPRSLKTDLVGVHEAVRSSAGVVLVPGRTPLKPLLKGATAVAGANSSVLTEARIMFLKPTYCYARSWYTNHTRLFTPISLARSPRPLNRLDQLLNPRLLTSGELMDYADWYLDQLLARQISGAEAEGDPAFLRRRVLFLSYENYRAHGEAIFTDVFERSP